MTEFVVIIPARLNSTRLPGKALADIGGKPMVQRVMEQASQSSARKVIVATDHSDIEKAVRQAGGEVLMTSADHPSGTDRLAECVNQLRLDDDDIIVNVQGDEPLIPPEVIDQVARNLATCPQAGMATLCEPIHRYSDFFNPNVVKVVFSDTGMGHYFSRAPIPWNRSEFPLTEPYPDTLSEKPLGHRHIGIYAYRAGLLRDFTTWSACDLEQDEALEQLRALWHDVRIHVDVAETTPPAGVDTPEDLERVRKIISRDAKGA